MFDRKVPNGKARKSFELCADKYDCKLADVVRHLARISAESDYRAFLNMSEMGYNPAQKDGPRK